MQIPLDIGGARLYASSCSTGQPIDWIWYSESNQTLYVYNQTVCAFKFGKALQIIRIDGWDNSNMYGVHWVKLTSTDNWNNRIDSNEFNVTINASLPPSQANKVDQINVYQNHYVDVKLPDYLFVNHKGIVSSFDTSHWVNSNDVKVATRITANQDDGSVNLYVKVFGNKGCQISVYTNSLFCQTSEALVDIVVLECASKEWFECSGPYESDCISCNSGYVLESGGSWVRDVNYLPKTNTKLYWICGLFAMIVALIYVILSFRYGRQMVEPAMHLQSLMMLALSTDWISSNLAEYLSWVQYFKFDFGFLNSFWLNLIVSWTPSDAKFANAKLYWQETIFNYANIFVFAVILFGLIKFIKIKRLSNLLKYLQTFEIEPQTTFVILWWLILPFMLVNVYYEFWNLSSHMMASFSMILVIVMFIMFWILKRSSFMSNKFVQSIDQYKSLACIYLTLLIRVPLLLLLVASSRTYKIALMIAVLTMQWSLLFALISHKVKLPLQHNFNRATELFSNSVMLIVVMVSTVDKVTLHLSHNDYRSWRHLQMNAAQVALMLRDSTQIQLYCCWWQQCWCDICWLLF